MNRTPRPVPGSRKAAVYAAYTRAAQIEAALKHEAAVRAMQTVAAASAPKPKGPKRDAKGRFVKKSA